MKVSLVKKIKSRSTQRNTFNSLWDLCHCLDIDFYLEKTTTLYRCVFTFMWMWKSFLTCCLSNCSASVLVMLLQYHLTGNKANHQSFTWQFEPPTGEICILYSRVCLYSVFLCHVVAWYESFIPTRKQSWDKRVQIGSLHSTKEVTLKSPG